MATLKQRIDALEQQAQQTPDEYSLFMHQLATCAKEEAEDILLAYSGSVPEGTHERWLEFLK